MKLTHRYAGLTGAALLMLASAAHAEAPARIPLQGVLTTASGAPIDGDVEVTFTLYASPMGTEGQIFTETRLVSADDGRFALQLGDGDAPLDLDVFGEVDGLWLGIAVDGDREMSPRIAMTTAPYAAHARTATDASTLDGFTADDFARVDDIDIDGLRADIDALTGKVGESSTLKAAVDSLKQAFAEQVAALDTLRDDVGEGLADTVAQLAEELGLQKEFVKSFDERITGLAGLVEALGTQLQALSGDGASELADLVSALAAKFTELESRTNARMLQMQDDLDLTVVELGKGLDAIATQNSALEAVASTLEDYTGVTEQLAGQVADVAQQAGATAQLASDTDFRVQAIEATAGSAAQTASQALASGEALAASLEYVQSDLNAALHAGDAANQAAIAQLISDYSASIGKALADSQAALTAIQTHVGDSSLADSMLALFNKATDVEQLAGEAFDRAAEASQTADTNAGLLLQKDAEIQSLTARIEALEAIVASMQH